MSNQLDNLFQEYCGERSLQLSKEQFSLFLTFFPALLIAASDGIVDQEEWLFCSKLARGLGLASDEDDPDSPERQDSLYKQEFKYLLQNLGQWEEKFLDSLKEYLTENQFAKEFVSETIYLFADASRGVSQEEMDKINNLEKRLALSS